MHQQNHTPQPNPNNYQQQAHTAPQQRVSPPQPNPNNYQQQAHTAPQQRETKNQYLSHHVYGSSGALTFQFSEYKGLPSINLDAAKSAGGRTYAWNQKITLMLNDNEVPHIIGVLLGMELSYEGRHHGQEKDKWFKIENQKNPGQKGVVFCQVGQGKGNAVSVPIGPEDCFYVATYCLAQLAKRFPGIDAGQIPKLISATSIRLTY